MDYALDDLCVDVERYGLLDRHETAGLVAMLDCKLGSKLPDYMGCPLDHAVSFLDEDCQEVVMTIFLAVCECVKRQAGKKKKKRRVAEMQKEFDFF